MDHSNHSMKFFGSEFNFSFESGETAKYHGYHLFDSFDELQSDGRTLLEHCHLLHEDDGFCSHTIMVNEDSIDDIIANFKLDEVNSTVTTVTKDEFSLLEQAVYGCIRDNKVEAIIKKDVPKIKVYCHEML